MDADRSRVDDDDEEEDVGGGSLKEDEVKEIKEDSYMNSLLFENVGLTIF